MDLYMDAKIRQQERLHEANIARLLKSAKARCASEHERSEGGLRSQFLIWLGNHLVASGTRLQTQCK
jgi:hypothetical protein